MTDDWALQSLRASRATPPGLAATDPERRVLYSAALEQFEQLLKAAQVVGPAARPLPLFYALSQAGRAIVAARGEEAQVSGHGLAEVRTAPAPDDVLHRRVKRAPSKSGRDAFGAVSRAIGSSDLVTPVQLGELWAGLPGTYRVPGRSWLPHWRSSLMVLEEATTEVGRTRVQVLSAAGNPHVGAEEALCGRYPSLPPDTTVGLKPQPDGLEPGNWFAVLMWDDTHDIDHVVPNDLGPDSRRHLIPLLAEHQQQPDLLMVWWALLFGFSILARYHPALWAQVLDVDRSEHAVPLEGVLKRALDAAPLLIHEAILGY